MRNKIAALVLVAVLICIGLFIVVDSALVEASATAARAPEEEWNRTFGGSSSDYAYSVQQTADGGYILAGRTYSYGAGPMDFWLVKTNSGGNEEWNRTFGGSDDDYARSVADRGWRLHPCWNDEFVRCGFQGFLVKRKSVKNALPKK